MSDILKTNPMLFLRDEELRRGAELLYFAWRDFETDADPILADHGLGRAHHRVVHFVGRRPGMPVTELLTYLRITKQSLSRVLGDLMDGGYVEQRPGTTDRRQRLLHLTEKGTDLESALTRRQRDRMAKAYREAGADAVAGFWTVLFNICDPAERKAIAQLVSRD